MYDVRITFKSGIEMHMERVEAFQIQSMTRVLWQKRGKQVLYIPIDNIEYWSVKEIDDNEQDKQNEPDGAE